MDISMKDHLASAGVETSQAIARFCGNEALYEKFLFKFLQDPTFSQLELAIQSKDYDTAQRAAHTLKGVAGNLSIQPLYIACSSLLSAIREQQTDMYVPLFDEVKTSYINICKVLGEIGDVHK